MDLTQLGVGALVIYGVVGEVKRSLGDSMPVVHQFAFLLNLGLGILFGYLGLFGISGLEAGILASLTSMGANSVVNKMKS